MTFDTCYLIYGSQEPDIHEICQFWETQGYRLKSPSTGKIEVWMPNAEDFEFINELDELPNPNNTIIHLWSAEEESLPFSVRKRGNSYSEEYEFKGTVGDEYMMLMNHLNHRYMQLTERGLLVAVLFDRKDHVLEALANW